MPRKFFGFQMGSANVPQRFFHIASAVDNPVDDVLDAREFVDYPVPPFENEAKVASFHQTAFGREKFGLRGNGFDGIEQTPDDFSGSLFRSVFEQVVFYFSQVPDSVFAPMDFKNFIHRF